MYTLEDVSGVANFITAYEELNKTETPIFLSVVCSLFPKAIFLTFIFIQIMVSIIQFVRLII